MVKKSSQPTLWKRELARYSGSCTSRLASSSWSNTLGPTNRKSPSLHRDRGGGGRRVGRGCNILRLNRRRGPRTGTVPLLQVGAGKLNPPVLHAVLDKALAAGQQLDALLRLAVALQGWAAARASGKSRLEHSRV